MGLKELVRRPTIAWPTITLLTCISSVWVASMLYIAKTDASTNPLVQLCMLACVICSYLSFTVAHDAVHGAVSTNNFINGLAGRISTVMLGPLGIYVALRRVHWQHHKHTNVPGKDPDLWTHNYLPGWLTIDIHYLYCIFRDMFRGELSLAEALEAVSSLGIYGYIVNMYWGTAAMWYGWIIPSRIAIIWLAMTFDYIPHSPILKTIREDRYKTTYFLSLPGSQWLLTTLLMAQDYHCVHHLWPTVPFYLYKKVYEAEKENLDSKGLPTKHCSWT